MTAPGAAVPRPVARAAPGDQLSRRAWPAAVLAVAALAVLPVAALAVSVAQPSADVWRQLWETRLPGQIVDTVALMVAVGAGALFLGTGLAWLCSAYRFPGSRLFGWALVLPLAMPAYILGFVALSIAGFTGPVQGWWRGTFGADAWFPPVESIGGAAVVFTLVLYPYVYLLGRAALREQAGAAYDVARSLGAGPLQAARRVALPLARPALVAGLAVVLMETLTDFATVQYFGVDTVSVGVFRVWKGSFDRDAASELAALVMVFALVVIGLERAFRGRARFGEAGGAQGGLSPRRLSGWRAAGATAACTAVLALAFGAPALQLLVWAIGEATGPRGTPLAERFPGYVQNSAVLAAATAGLCVLFAVVVANGARFTGRRTARIASRLTTVGYALPGPVVAIGALLVLVALDDALGLAGLELPGLVVTGSFAGLLYAYAVRFLAPAYNAVEAGLGQVSPDVTASARTLGARPGRVLTRVHLPLSAASIATGGILVAVDALKELPIVLLLRPFGYDTLSVWVWNLASESRWEQAALPALAIVAVAAAPVVLLSRRLDRRRAGR